jgi:hypothetical protein
MNGIAMLPLFAVDSFFRIPYKYGTIVMASSRM